MGDDYVPIIVRRWVVSEMKDCAIVEGSDYCPRRPSNIEALPIHQSSEASEFLEVQAEHRDESWHR